MSLEDVIEETVRRVLREELSRLAGPSLVAPLPKLLTMKEAARQLSCSRSKLKGLLRDGEISASLVGRRRMIAASEVERMAKPSAAPAERRRRAKVTRAQLQAVTGDAAADAVRAAIKAGR